MYKEITDYLDCSERSMEQDKKIFLQYILGEITVEKCLELFLQNNRFPKTKKVSTDYFIKWLGSIGWER